MSAARLALVPENASERGRVRRLAERLQSLGVAEAVVAETAGEGTSLVVRGWPPDGRSPVGTAAGALALVYSSEDPQRVGIDQRLVRLDQARRLRSPATRAEAGSGIPAGAET